MSTHLDHAQLSELKEVLEDEFATLVQTYLHDADLRMSHIDEALRRVDNDAGRMASHSLKGASANLGASMLSQLCEKLEHACRSGQLATCAELVEQVRAELALVKAGLQEHL